MAVDDGNLDIGDFEDLFPSNLEKEYCGWLSPSSFGESEPYVPPLSIQDLERFLYSTDDFTSLNDVGLADEYQSCFFSSPEGQDGNKEVKKDETESLLKGLSGFTRKKGRTKKYQKPKGRLTWVSKRCSHCQTEETPLWRAGPMGPKTLCNACGVRFKSGRLVPEYRPATSPTFDSHRHSNYHKNVLKLRSSSSS